MSDILTLIAMGAAFLVLGLISVIIVKNRKKAFFESLHYREDVRRFLTRWPENLWIEVLQVGGWTSVIVGGLLVIIGCIALIWY